MWAHRLARHEGDLCAFCRVREIRRYARLEDRVLSQMCACCPLYGEARGRRRTRRSPPAPRGTGKIVLAIPIIAETSLTIEGSRSWSLQDCAASRVRSRTGMDPPGYHQGVASRGRSTPRTRRTLERGHCYRFWVRRHADVAAPQSLRNPARRISPHCLGAFVFSKVWPGPSMRRPFRLGSACRPLAFGSGPCLLSAASRQRFCRARSAAWKMLQILGSIRGWLYAPSRHASTAHRVWRATVAPSERALDSLRAGRAATVDLLLRVGLAARAMCGILPPGSRGHRARLQAARSSLIAARPSRAAVYS